MVYRKKYLVSPGSFYFIAPELTNVSVLHVARQGVSYTRTYNEEATGLQFIYTAFSGTIVFDPNNPFVLSPELAAAGSYLNNVEKILVIWKV